jgi:hypothetical protein
VLHRPLRPLAVVVLLALGDYMLWNWSLSTNHDVFALVSGLSLIPLLIALAWLLVVTAARLLARIARSRVGVQTDQRIRRAGSPARRPARTSASAGAARAGLPRHAAGGEMVTSTEPLPASGEPASTPPGRTPTASPSSKIAA